MDALPAFLPDPRPTYTIAEWYEAEVDLLEMFDLDPDTCPAAVTTAAYAAVNEALNDHDVHLTSPVAEVAAFFQGKVTALRKEFLEEQDARAAAEWNDELRAAGGDYTRTASYADHRQDGGW